MIDFSFHGLFQNIPGVHRRALACGEVLFRQGDPADLVFSVETGELRLVRYTSDGHTVCLHTARNGDSFAEAALFTDTYHCNGEAAKDSHIWCYPRTAVLQQLASDTACMEKVFSLMAEQVRYMRLMLELRTIRSAPERILQLLRLRADAGGVVFIRGNLLEWARELGLAHETFYRSLAELEQRGNIKRLESRLILIIDT